MSEGWSCPQCGQVWAPWMPSCTRCANPPAVDAGANPLPSSPMDLLSDDERASLARDLAHMARQRRAAEVEARDLPVG